MNNVLDVIKEQIRESIFGELENWEIDEELNKSMFKEFVKKTY